MTLVGDGVADFYIGGRFNIRDEIPDIPWTELRLHEHLRSKHTDLLDLITGVVAHQRDRVIRFHRSGHDADVTNHTTVNVEYRIEHERAQGFIRRFLRRRDALHNPLKNFLDTDSHLRARFDRFLGRDCEDFLQLSMDGRHIGVWQIDFIDDRNNRQPLFVCQMNVRHCLGLNPLRRVNNQQRAFARRETARNLVGKINMSRGVKQVKPIHLARFTRVTHRHRMRFDCDSPLALQVHRIEQLVLLLAFVDRTGALEQSIGQCRLAVIDVRDDTKITRQLNGHESRTMLAEQKEHKQPARF